MKLGRVKVASPCRESWQGMTGDDQVRHCQRCDKFVYNLSAMTTDEAEALLASRGESMCVRLYQRADGTVKTADCPSPLRWPVAAVGAAALAVGAVAVAGRPEPRRLPVVTVPPPPPASAPSPPVVVPHHDVPYGPAAPPLVQPPPKMVRPARIRPARHPSDDGDWVQGVLDPFQ
jgi:hypothetical protein